LNIIFPRSLPAGDNFLEQFLVMEGGGGEVGPWIIISQKQNMNISSPFIFTTNGIFSSF
jgi:hypothetical protein